MRAFQNVVNFGTAPKQAVGDPSIRAFRIEAQPLVSNSAASAVALSSSANLKTGAGIVRQFGAGLSILPFIIEAPNGGDLIRVSDFYFLGTSGQAMLVTYWQE